MPDTIETRYRDISYEELRVAHPDAHCTKKEWEPLRGKSARIRTAQVDPTEVIGKHCGGPFYDEIGKVSGDLQGVTCPHEAEIGD